HPGLARQPSRDDDDVGPGGRVISATVGRRRDTDDLGPEPPNRGARVQAKGQSFRPTFDDVGEHDGVQDVVLSQSLRSGGTVEPGSDDSDLAAAVAGGGYSNA